MMPSFLADSALEGIYFKEKEQAPSLNVLLSDNIIEFEQKMVSKVLHKIEKQTKFRNEEAKEQDESSAEESSSEDEE